MPRKKAYKIATLILSIVVIIESAFLVYLWMRKPKAPKVPIIKGKIAIVIDDWGYNLNNFYILEEIKSPLTVSVLPNLAYSRSAAQALHKHGAQVILHLPLEPHEKFRLEKNTILTSMDEETIRNIVRQDLDALYYVRGVSNHMGSRATEDPRTMGIIFSELKKKNLFFLDSLVSPRTVCFSLAKKMQIPFARRDIFLDNKEEAGYIRGQIQKLKIRARVYGQAVGIGHDQKTTLEVLREAMPELEKEGYKFVFISELVK